MIRIQLFIVFISIVTSTFCQRQYTLQDAEQQLQKNNLQLLAKQYDISVSESAIIQAKIWEQPYLSTEFNAVNPQDGKVFDFGDNGQKAAAIQQLIYIGGKKRNEIAYAKSNAALAALEFEQLLRNLRYQLQQIFYSVYFDNQKIKSIDAQIANLDSLVSNYNIQAQKGNIPLREVVRLQSLVLNLRNEKTDLSKDMIEAQQNLSLLTGVSGPISPVVNEPLLLEKFQKKLASKDIILSSALTSNLEYLGAIKTAESQGLYLKWQKSLAIPDLTAGLSYDQRGGAFQNQVNFTLGIPLPLWNRNKGNIKIAEAQLKQLNTNTAYKKLELTSKVETYWQIWQQQSVQYQSIDKSTIHNNVSVYNGMLSNFQKRNVSMLEFTDFMESYNQSLIQINEIKKSLVLSGIDLNYIANKEIF